ncbi:MAG TPA: hypothetical protein VKA64_03405, partial [Gammaproteobacteria bacterium]|nr:hypothetical protein [Gammaproteobacteria bacterium]
MATETVQVRGTEEVQTMLRRARDDQYEIARLAFRDTIRRAHRRVTRERLTGRPGLNRRTGQLARSIKTDVRGTKTNDLQGRVYTDPKVAPYAGVHETG